MCPEMNTQIGKTLFKDMNWRGLRPLQKKSFSAISQGNNTLITAGTASGKTEAALLPVLSMLVSDPELAHSNSPVALYIAPLKALINDIFARLQKLAQRSPLKVFSWHSDVESAEKSLALQKSSILVTTPESIEGMFVSKKVDPRLFFQNLRFLLIDELHALISGPRGAQLSSLMERLEDISRFPVQRVAMSATIGNPPEVLHWLRGGNPRPCLHVHDEASSQKRVWVREKSLEKLVSDLEEMMGHQGKGILFTSSKQEAELLYHYLREKGFPCLLHHGSIGKEIREKTEILFKTSPSIKIMIATTTLEMGIDIGDVSYVFFYSVPRSAASFMQRLGRAGRKVGVAKALVYVPTDSENREKMAQEHLFLFGNLQLLLDGEVEPLAISDFYPQILAHQLLSMVLEKGKIPLQQIGVLRNAFPFQAITPDVLQKELDFLQEQNWIFVREGEIRLGTQAANKLSGMGLGDFVSVFQTGKEFRVFHGSKEIGKIHSATFASAEKLASAGMNRSFILAGRAWKIVKADLQQKTVQVEPDRSGIKPLWLGQGELVAYRFADAIGRFLLNPPFADFQGESKHIKVDPEVQDALLQTMDEEKEHLQQGESWSLRAIQKKRSVDLVLYNYSGDLFNLLLSLLLPFFEPSIRNVRWNYRGLRFRSQSAPDMDALLSWLVHMDFSAFEEKMNQVEEQAMQKVGEKIFQDSCTSFIPYDLYLQAVVRVLWKAMQEALKSLGSQSQLEQQKEVV